MSSGKIAVGSDHAGFALKREIIELLKVQGYEVLDHGTYDETSVDYPDFAKKVAESVLRGEVSKGILICGTGIGISIAANRFKGIRAALCYDAFTAKMSRMHNDSNILAMGAHVIGNAVAKDIVQVWLKESFEGGRHERRINKLDSF